MKDRNTRELNIFVADRLYKKMSNWDMALEAFNHFENRNCESCKNYDDCQVIDILHDENADVEDDKFSCNNWGSK